jgi:hypothetical protein
LTPLIKYNTNDFVHELTLNEKLQDKRRTYDKPCRAQQASPMVAYPAPGERRLPRGPESACHVVADWLVAGQMARNAARKRVNVIHVVARESRYQQNAMRALSVDTLTVSSTTRSLYRKG